MKLLLLDMDGVLLQPNGYHEALQENVRLWGRALGFGNVVLSRDSIYRFESAGVSAEWVSGSLCVALMMIERWKQDPDMPIPSSLVIAEDEVPLPTPDFDNFSKELLAVSDHHRPVELAVGLLESRCSSPEQVAALRRLIEAATSFEASLLHRIQQELVLGSERMQDVYGVTPTLETEGYLLTRDRAALTSKHVTTLLEWMGQEGHGAALMTNRPTRWPGGPGGSPEAELGLQLLGLETLPFAGMGAASWLAEQQGLQTEALLKPHAAHALAAIRLALGEGELQSLSAVHALLIANVVDDGWRSLDGASIIVLEDSANGCLSATAAAGVLAKAGLHLNVRLYGVARSASKRDVLSGLGAGLYADSGDALLDAMRC